MNRVARLLSPPGAVIDVAIPRWLVGSLRLIVAGAILGALALAAGALVVQRGGSDHATAGGAFELVAARFEDRPVRYEVRVTAAARPMERLDREWTLLLSSGSVHWANVVEGPARLAAGQSATVVLSFAFEPTPAEGEPVALRWDPDRKVTASVDLRTQP
ncbi:MAG TPA: hypothetical protein PKI89_09620 [Tepidiformaceae bacterium]|nr:hypothetical protein [Dehalococcoidia bacterium]HNM78613.1 hypothetical protein [Tepidiformaceae bacterium]HNO66110.1 hypothetical protein [Tepidiformaceae bacterium]